MLVCVYVCVCVCVSTRVPLHACVFDVVCVLGCVSIDLLKPQQLGLNFMTSNKILR